jgi:hypothetical protein
VKRALKLTLSILLTLVCGWLAFRNTNWDEMWGSLRTANYLWLVPYLGVLAVIHLCRTLRWGCLLSGLEKVGFRQLNEASGIGFMMLIALPFRLGEFARPFLIARRSGIRRSAAMTTVVLERITDGIAIAVLLRVLIAFVPESAPNLHWVRFAANAMFGLFFGGLVFLLFALWQQQRAVRLVQATVGRVSPRLAHVAGHIVDTFVGAMRQLPSPGQMVLFFLFTAGYWAANGAGMALLARAFGGPGQPFELSVFQGYLVMCALVVGVMIPGAPGMAGTFQLAVTLGLGLFFPQAVVKSTGLAYANVLWLAQTTQQVALGMILMMAGGLSFKEITRNLEEEEERAGQVQEGAPAVTL